MMMSLNLNRLKEKKLKPNRYLVVNYATMCYRTRLNAKLEDIEKSFDAYFEEKEHHAPNEEINGFVHSPYLVIIDEGCGKIQFYS